MEQHYHTITQQQMPSQQEVETYKDFDKLLATYQTQTVKEGKIRNIFPYWLLASFAVAASLAGVYFFWQGNTINTESYFQQQSAYFQQKPFIDRPFENIEPAVADFNINVSETIKVTSPKGTTLTFPEQAFQDENGRLVQGEVRVRFYEFHDQVDIFLSGIPMSYDSLGTNYAMQSAGVLEIYAEQNGKRLQLVDNKSINVSLASTVALPKHNEIPSFNVYQLDVNAKKWVYQELNAISKLASLTSSTNETANTHKEIAQQEREAIANLTLSLPEPVAPVAPVKRNKNLPTLELDFLESLTSAAKALRAQYDGAVWQLTETSPALPQDAGKVEWEDATITLLSEDNKVYELVLISQQRREKLFITPVLPSKAFAEAMKVYEQEKAAYEIALQAYNKDLETQKQRIQQAFEKERANLLKVDTSNNQKLVNEFRINELGIWMCSKPLPLLKEALTLTLSDESGKIYENITGYLFNTTQNTLQRFLVTKQTLLTLEAQTEYWLLIVTDNKQVAVLDPKSLEQIRQQKIPQKVTLKFLDRQISKEADVRAVFEL